ncbi:MAG: glycoside hydrolase [Eudoraea sp.]|nr:glycoside hydrolase [Eudoraea sp.]
MRKIGLLFLSVIQFSCSSQKAAKINGVSFVASRDKVAQKHVDEILKVHANHAAVMPFGFIREVNSPEIIFDTNRQWFGETMAGAKQYIELLKENNIQVMIKPQIWISNGVFTGTLQMSSEEQWRALEASYEQFLMANAKLAEDLGAELLCIGTELEKFVENRPEFWRNLISKIRAVYHGKLTYAANWDEYKRTPFWGELDYIGVDAYFPLSEEKTPTVEQLKYGWKPWKEKISAISKEFNRPILFTEFGYRSMDYNAKKPWLVDRSDQGVNLAAQVNAKKAIFEEFWNEDWFAGGYVWKWFINHENAGGGNDNRFTPQNKPAQEVIGYFYQRH